MKDLVGKHGATFTLAVAASTVATLLAAWLGRLAFWQALAFVVAPIVLLALLSAGVRLALRWRRDLDRLQTNQAELAGWLRTVELRLSEHVMFDILRHVRGEGWTVQGDVEGIRFTAPDEATVVIPTDELNWYVIVQTLHQASPEHISKDWTPPAVANLSLANLTALRAQIEAGQVARRVDVLEQRMKPVPRGEGIAALLTRRG